jgi:hypothetical protein
LYVIHQSKTHMYVHGETRDICTMLAATKPRSVSVHGELIHVAMHHVCIHALHLQVSITNEDDVSRLIMWFDSHLKCKDTSVAPTLLYININIIRSYSIHRDSGMSQ